MTQHTLDIRRRRLTALFVLVGLAFFVYGVAAGRGWSIPSLQPPVSNGTKVDTRQARAGRTLADSSALTVTPAQTAIGVARLERSRKPLFCGGAKPYMALTFDDGPSPTTAKLVKLLRDSGVSATFFVLGDHLNTDRSSVRAMRSVGELANHSWSHPAFTKLTPKGIKSELQTTQNLIRSVQSPTPSIVRPPYGARDEMVDRVLAKQHLADILWSADTRDALNATWQQVADNAVQGMGPGAIVLMHDGPEVTLTALRKKILPAARRKQLHFVTLSELLVTNPPSEAQLAAGPQGCAHAGERNVTGLFFKPSEQLNYQP